MFLNSFYYTLLDQIIIFIATLKKNPLFPRENQLQIARYLDGQGQFLSYKLIKEYDFCFYKITSSNHRLERL